MFYKGKKVLVTGGTGLIGQPLVRMLIEQGAQVRVASLDDPSRAHPQAEFRKVNLVKFDSCMEVCQGMDFVFNLVGIKGSPAMTVKRTATIFVSNLLFNTNMMEAARQCDVAWYLFTSTIGVYAPAEVFHEDDVWKRPPSENDKFAGWAKRMGELQAEAYAIEYDWRKVSIIRPANVYGPYDNFDPQNGMVIPSLIRRAVEGEDPFVVWGDGSPVRDFIYSEDVARGMLMAAEKGVTEPLNLGSGSGISIKQLVDVVVRNLPRQPKVVWDTSKPAGDRKRLMDISRARGYGFEPQIPIEKGVSALMEWYAQHKTDGGRRYNVLAESKLV